MARTEKDEKYIEIARTLHNIPWCEDYEKMISGMLYNSLVPELEYRRFQARRWCHKYNSWFPEDPKANMDTLAKHRLTLLRENLGYVGDEVFIEPPFTVDYGCNLRLGERVYANFNLTILDCSFVTVGARTMFGPNVSIFASTHETSVQSRRDYIEYGFPITIGEDCWIGGHAIILSGVTIGDGVTIGAGSVVTKDIPSWSVAVGSPAKVIKKVEPLGRLPDNDNGFVAQNKIIVESTSDVANN